MTTNLDSDLKPGRESCDQWDRGRHAEHRIGATRARSRPADQRQWTTPQALLLLQVKYFPIRRQRPKIGRHLILKFIPGGPQHLHERNDLVAHVLGMLDRVV